MSLLGRPTVHQVVEYAVGFGLAGAAVRSDDRMLLVIAATAVIANTAIMQGPLAAYRTVPHGIHRVIDICLAVVGIGLAFSSGAGLATRAWLIGSSALVAFMSVRFVHVIRETGS